LDFQRKETIMGAKRNVDMSATETKVKVVKVEEKDKEKATKKSVAKTKTRSKKYQAKRALIDRTKEYPLKKAVELVKKTSYTKFDGTISASMVFKEVGEQAKLTLPHSTGKSVKVAIASDELIDQIASGKIDFDVLISTPEFVPKLARYARVLGPKGLMPNPKNGTITTNPEKRAKELSAGEITIKTDRKQPVAHVSVGKVSQADKEIIANIQALIKAVTGKLQKLTLSATMSPGIKVKLGKE